jgi:cytochrome b6-f complex iron-sulfur subunit
MPEKKKGGVRRAKPRIDGPVTRRALLQAGIGLAGACYAAALGYPVYRYLASPAEEAEQLAKVTEVELPDAEDLAVGTALMFKFGIRPALLIHHADGEWTALDAKCTHLGCTVAYQPDQDRIYCACHGGVYDSRTGKNVSGPPPRPLTAYNVEVTDGKVIVSRA